MELVFLYVNLSKNEFIEKCGFNFSPNYYFEIEYQEGLYTLLEKSTKKIVSENFFDESGCISNITAIVGENGVGKTTLLDYIFLSDFSVKQIKNNNYDDYFLEQYEYKKKVAIYKDGNQLICYHNIENFNTNVDFKCIYLSKDSNELKDMLVYNKDYKNLTKIFITNSQYSIGELSTHGSLSMLALNPNSLNLLKQSFYEKSYFHNKKLYGGFYEISVMLGQYRSLSEFQSILDVLYLKYISKQNEKSIFENLLKRNLKISFKRIDIYLKRWIDKINGQNINDKDDKTQLKTYYDIWQSALSNMENAAFKDDIVLVLYENLLFELIAINRLKKTDLKEFTNKDELIEYIDGMVKDKNKECFKDAYEEIKLYERCLEKCSRYSCLLPKGDLAYSTSIKIKYQSEELSEFFGLIENSMFNNKSSFVLKYINIEGLDLSSGERAMLNFFSWIHMISYYNKIGTNVKESTFDNILLLIDEIDLYCHPSWQQKLLNHLIREVKFIFKEKNVQIIFATHSPIVLSDMPKSNILYLKKTDGKLLIDKNENHSETFGTNIYKLFDDAFFLEKQGQIGEFAKMKITSLIKEVMDIKEHDYDSEYMNQLKNKISLIGEPLIREKLLSMLVRIEYNDSMDLREKRIMLYEERLKQLKGE